MSALVGIHADTASRRNSNEDVLSLAQCRIDMGMSSPPARRRDFSIFFWTWAQTAFKMGELVKLLRILQAIPASHGTIIEPGVLVRQFVPNLSRQASGHPTEIDRTKSNQP